VRESAAVAGAMKFKLCADAAAIVSETLDLGADKLAKQWFLAFDAAFQFHFSPAKPFNRTGKLIQKIGANFANRIDEIRCRADPVRMLRHNSRGVASTVTVTQQ
jgi:hypothetical protein